MLNKEVLLRSGADAAVALRAWLVEEGLPLWSTAGFDRASHRFHERLDWSGRPVADAPRRAMVQARQIYVFAHAAHLGWLASGADLAQVAMDSLLRDYRLQSGESGAFAFSIGERGEIVSSVHDTYAHAFILFALAWLYRLTGDPRLLGAADETLAFLDRRLADPRNGGYFDAFPIVDRGKRQNPHMHLLEALLAFEAAAPGRGYLERTAGVVSLLERRFFDREHGALLEYFAEDWSPPKPVDKRDVVEPGHHYEWAWLLTEHTRLSGEDHGSWIEILTRNALRAERADGLIYEEVQTDFRPRRASHRLWPHAEKIKAAAAAASRGDRDASELAAKTAQLLMDTFLRRPFPGGWVDRIDGDRSPLVDHVPASSLYHIFFATAELVSAFPKGLRCG